MAKKARPKQSAPKARRKQRVAKKAPARATSSRTARKPKRPPATSKYDQPGAPWWKKFRPSEAGPAESKR